MAFTLHTTYLPAGDQPEAIKKLTSAVKKGYRHQTLLGVTGSGKTYTMANVIQNIQKPTLVMCHNKTLAAQLANEFQVFFPENAVHYFVSYYDYYQPEAYIPRSDTYIEKDTQINEEIDRLRNAATSSLMSRQDVIIVASVSCIYGLGSPDNYLDLSLPIKKGMSLKRDKFLRRLTDMQYSRNDIDLRRGTFRVQGDTIDIVLSSEDTIVRLSFFGDEVEKINRLHLISGETLERLQDITIFPARHFVTTEEKLQSALERIKKELAVRLKVLKNEGKILEASRLEQRTNFDLEMLNNTGFVAGIENYSRVIENREPGSPPSTLLDYFPDDFLLFVDESHQTIPQVGAMYEGDRSRKTTLVDYGFRLPSALDNRPLKFSEFENKINQVIYVSATPGPYELTKSLQENYLVNNPKKKILEKDVRSEVIIEQINRPTGLLDPIIEIHSTEHQVDHLLKEIAIRVKNKERVLVTTLTKRMAEELSEYIQDAGIKSQYLHSDVETFDRLEILRDLRLGVYDVLIGINLLREGLDLPEVSLVAILDADKEGFLRSETAFMQIMGRSARHLNGKVIMYADKITGSMQRAIDETKRRRNIQEAFNKSHGITPTGIHKNITNSRLAGIKNEEAKDESEQRQKIEPTNLTPDALKRYLAELSDQMDLASKNLEFELAAELRDEISEIKKIAKIRKL